MALAGLSRAPGPTFFDCHGPQRHRLRPVSLKWRGRWTRLAVTSGTRGWTLSLQLYCASAGGWTRKTTTLRHWNWSIATWSSELYSPADCKLPPSSRAPRACRLPGASCRGGSCRTPSIAHKSPGRCAASTALRHGSAWPGCRQTLNRTISAVSTPCVSSFEFEPGTWSALGPGALGHTPSAAKVRQRQGLLP